MKRILVIAAHPDDEMLGCGGTIKKFINSGCEVVTVIVAKGRPDKQRRINRFCKRANAQLGVANVVFLDYPNLKLETYPLHEIIEKLAVLVDTYEPEVVLTHYQGDINRDHQVTFEAVRLLARDHPHRGQLTAPWHAPDARRNRTSSQSHRFLSRFLALVAGTT